MTAINIVKLPTSVHLFCDTMASIDGIGVLDVVKCIPLPHMQAAIATRGAGLAVHLLARMASGFKDFDDLQTRFAEGFITASKLEQACEPDNQVFRQSLDVFVIGWGQSGPGAFAFFNHNDHGIPAWQRWDIPYIVTTPVLAPVAFEQLEGAADPLPIIPHLMQEQCNGHPGVVGGHITQTTIASDGIRMRTLGRMVKASSPRPEVARSLPPAFARHLAVGVH